MTTTTLKSITLCKLLNLASESLTEMLTYYHIAYS